MVSQYKYDLDRLYRRIDEMYGLGPRGTHTAWRHGKYVFIGDEVYASSGEGIEVEGRDSRKSFSFSGLLFGNLSVVERQGCDKLYIVMSLPYAAHARFPYESKSFRKNVLECRAVSEPFFKLSGFFCKTRLFEFFDIALVRVNLFDKLVESRYFFLIAIQKLCDEVEHPPILPRKRIYFVARFSSSLIGISLQASCEAFG